MRGKQKSPINITLVLIVLSLVAVATLATSYSLATIGARPSHYQGIQLVWYGADVGSVDSQKVFDSAYTANVNHLYTAGDTYKIPNAPARASVSSFMRTDFNLDVDSAEKAMPNLRGSVDQPYPSSDYNTDGYAGLRKTYEWDIGDKHYEMHEWVYEFDVNVVCTAAAEGERNGIYMDTDLWLRVESFAPNYFTVETDEITTEGVYVGLGAIEITNIKAGTYLKADIMKEFGIDANMDEPPDVNINTGLEVMMFYDAPDKVQAADGGQTNLNDFRGYEYQGATLNPDIFRDYWYVPIHIVSIETDEWGQWVFYGWRVEAFSFHAKIYAFSVGEYTVIKEEHADWGQLIGGYGEASSWDRFWSGIGDFFGGIGDWFGSITGMIVTLLIIIAAVFVGMMLLGKMGGRKRRGGAMR